MPDKTMIPPSDGDTSGHLLKPDSDSKYNDLDKLELWKRRISVAKRDRDEYVGKDHNVLIDYYKGNQWHNADGLPILEDNTTVNLIFANIKKEMPYLYYQNPTPIVEAKRMEFETGAIAAQELLRFYTKYNLKTSLKKHIRLAILDSKFAFGCMKAIYTPKFESNPNAGDPIQIGIDAFNDPVYLTDDEGNLVSETNMLLVSELFAAERISPKDMLIDPECGNFIERSKWIGQEIIKSLDYIKRSPLYKNTDDLQSNVTLEEVLRRTSEKAIRELDEERVKIYEMYDIETKELLVLAEGHTKFIRIAKFNVQPFSILKFNEIPDEFYALADVAVEKPLQQEINVSASMVITHARRASRKYVYEEKSISDEQLENLKDPGDMTFAAIKDWNKPPKALESATQDPSIFQYTSQSKINFNEVVGSTEMERGVVERRKTFGEAKFQEGHGSARRSDKQSLVADFVSEIYTNIFQLMQFNLNTEQAIKVIGPKGKFWTKVKREDIQGEYFVDIEVAELRPNLPEVEKADLIQFVQILGQFLMQAANNPLTNVVVNIKGLISELARSYPNLNVEKILNMGMTPNDIAKMAVAMNQQGQNKNKGA